MNKLSIRPRNLDACKFLPIYKCEEIPDLNDYASINRSIPQLPTGMEKEEESEHHLQQAISAQQSKGTTGELVIPTPEVYDAPESFYNQLYPQNFKLPRQLIHVQPFAFEHEIPDYDRDTEDEEWLDNQKDVISNLIPTKFEELIDCFDKSSSQHVISLHEAKSLIKEDEDLIVAVYDYWLNKRLRLQTPLIPMVKTERRDTSSTNNSNNPYIAFRRRTEKMQTRKNRKNDEISYEKMIKLRRDLSRSLNLLQLVKQREEYKKEHVKLTVDIFEKRYLLGDYNGNIINEINAQRQAATRQASNNYLPINNVLKPNENKPPRNKDDTLQPRKKREYRKRHRQEVIQRTEQEISEFTFTSEDEELNDNLSHSVSDQDEDDSDGPYAFKRKKGCQYYAPLSDPFGNWPYYSAEERVSSNLNKYCLTEIHRQNNKRRFEYARRRLGRGGRMIFDRAQFDSPFNQLIIDDEELNNDDKFDYFRPKSPIKNRTYLELCDDEDSSNDLLYIKNGNLNSSVPINLNDYLYEEDDLYSNCRTKTDADLAKFTNHQKELIEVQRLQKEKLLMNNNDLTTKSRSSNLSALDQIKYSTQSNRKSNEPVTLTAHTIRATVNLIDSSCNNNGLNDKSYDSNHSTTNNNLINNNQQSSSMTTNHHFNSSPSIDHNISSNYINNNNDLNIFSLSNTTSLPQKSITSPSSTLDPESVSFAVSAVLNNTVNCCPANNNSSFLSSTVANSNGPTQLRNHILDNNDKYSNYSSFNQHTPSQLNNSSSMNYIMRGDDTPSSFTNLQQTTCNALNTNQLLSHQQSSTSTITHQLIPQPQWSNQSTNQQSNESNMYKIFQNNNQNSITPTDVT